MALLFFDGFDDTNNPAEKYINGTNFGGTKSILATQTNVHRTSGKFSGYAIIAEYKNLAIELPEPVSTIYVTLDVKPSSYFANRRTLVYFNDTTFEVRWSWFTGLAILENSIIRKEKVITVIPTAFSWLSIRYTVSATSGLIEVRDAFGNVLISYSGNTRGMAATDNVLKRLEFDNSYIDNLCVFDSSGPPPFNGNLTEVRAIQLLPDAEGDLTEWSPVGADTVLDAVNEQIGNDDSNYASTDTNGQMFLVGTEDILTNENNLLGVIIKSRLKRDDAGIWRIAHVVKTGGNIYESEQTPITNANLYLNVLHAFPNNPNTGNAWTLEEINDLQIGAKAYLG